jgi:NitT/TauT family transport system ATP-binding protein
LEEAICLSDRVIVLTAGPGKLLGDYVADLPRPRDLLDLKTDPKFSELYRKIWAHLGSEVLRAHKLNPLGVAV